MSDATARTTTTKSGIATTSSGDRHIPSSQRADGSVRKEIRVRPGYRPPEDVEIYKNRTAEAWKTRGKGGVPGAQFVAPKAAPKGGPKRALKATPAQTPSEAKQPCVPSTAQKEEINEDHDPEARAEREAKKLTKKLRQAKELQQKKDEGGSLLPEQLEKVVRISELVRQLDLVGYDASGNKKDV